MLERLAREALGPLLGRRRLQPLFEAMHKLSLAGLGIGEGRNPASSGEIRVMRLVRDDLYPDGRPLVLFDVGANVGDYTLLLNETFGGRASIFAFEPAGDAFQVLVSRTSELANVRAKPFGFSEAARSATLVSAGPASKVGSLHAGRARPGALEQTVELTTVDRFCSDHEIERVHLLKLDVEGHELSILDGAETMLAGGRIDALQFEFGAADIDSRTFFRDFFDRLSDRYGIYRVLRHGLYPIREYSESLEVFRRATNYLALRRTLVDA